ncbi:hypothetical protein [Kocuria sp. TGY1127_2]|uniref:hypothetical protein n=1 Tax=Kocuria sp. TGY1127_2 TaxID=2711328 RepID=UPI0015C1A957|nr:hypothetical protein [Kocuria sp. TGY1127_2]
MSELATLTIDPAAASPQKMQMPVGTLGALQELYRVLINSPMPRPLIFTFTDEKEIQTWTVPVGSPVQFHFPLGSFDEEQDARFKRQVSQLEDRVNSGEGITFDANWEIVDHSETA